MELKGHLCKIYNQGKKKNKKAAGRWPGTRDQGVQDREV
jgi:hypothetical protein